MNLWNTKPTMSELVARKAQIDAELKAFDEKHPELAKLWVAQSEAWNAVSEAANEERLSRVSSIILGQRVTALRSCMMMATASGEGERDSLRVSEYPKGSVTFYDVEIELEDGSVFRCDHAPTEWKPKP